MMHTALSTPASGRRAARALRAAALSLALGAASAAHAAPLKIGMTFQELNNPYFVTMQKALDEAAASIGAQVIVTDAHHDVSKQVSDVEDMLQKKIDILLVNPTDSTGIQSAVVSAKKAGAVVVAVDANANGPVDAFVGSKNFDAGAMSCDYLAKAIGGGGEVAILDGIPVVPILERVRGCRAALAKFPNVRIVDVQNGRQERASALAVTENMIQAHPLLKGVFSVNDGGSRRRAATSSSRASTARRRRSRRCRSRTRSSSRRPRSSRATRFASRSASGSRRSGAPMCRRRFRST